jgi:hypothetical protein
MPVPPTFPVTTLTVRPWVDAVIDELGHDARSPYVERFWLGILGPSATWLMRRLVGGLEASPAGFELDLASTATELGLGNRSGPSSPFMRSIQRCCRFGAADLQDDTTLRVRRKLPPLTRIQIERLPDALRAEHQLWLERPLPGSALAYEEQRQRSRQMALSLLELGEDGEATERQLYRWRVHPAMAHDATAWAVARYNERHAQADATAAGAGGGDGPPDAA